MSSLSGRFQFQTTSGLTPIADTTSHLVLASPGSLTSGTRGDLPGGQLINVTDVELTNSSAVATIVTLLAGATVIAAYNVPATSGVVISNFATPLKVGQGVNLNIQNVTTASAISYNIRGYYANQ